MINPSIYISRSFREQVQKCLGYYFSNKTVKTIRYFLLNKNTSVMVLIIIYENSGKDTRIVYRVLSCGSYALIDNYVCIDYLPCQSKTLSEISRNPTFKDTSFKLLLGIGIPELLLDIVSCHGFNKKPNSTGILNCQYFLINDYL